MLWRIAWFELRFWLRSSMLWACLLTIGLLVFGAWSSDEVMAEFGLSNTYRNAPFAIAFAYAATGMFTLLMTAVFVNFAALRDFAYNTHPLIFSTPVRRRDLLLGRFVGATVVSLIPMLGVSCGILIAQHMPWVDPERWGMVNWQAHVTAFAVFALPDTFVSAALLFAAAVLWRRELASFVAAIALFTGRALVSGLFQDLRWEHLRALLDPFGVRAFALATKYWTVADRKAQAIALGGPLLLNRGLWVAVGGAAFALAYSRFSAIERPGRGGAPAADTAPEAGPAAHSAPRPRLTVSLWPRFCGSCTLHFRGMAKNTAFVVIATIACILCALALAEPATQLQSNETYRILPVTYQVIETVRQALDLFLLVIITYFSGALVWKDRDCRMDAILDATPTPEVVSYAARLVTLVGMVLFTLVQDRKPENRLPIIFRWHWREKRLR
jgi:hypothetical protein